MNAPLGNMQAATTVITNVKLLTPNATFFYNTTKEILVYIGSLRPVKTYNNWLNRAELETQLRVE